MMKAQAALLEALVAALILAAAGVVVANAAYESSLSSQYGTISMQNAVFDLENLAYSNTGLGACIRDANSSCVDVILKNVNEHYGLSYSELNIGNALLSEGNYTECANSDYYCFPAESNLSYYQVCEYVCYR